MKRNAEPASGESAAKKSNTRTTLSIVNHSSFLHEHFNNNKFSDFKLNFKNGKTLDLHKIILCPQSEFFDSCLTIGMQESQENKIEAEEEEEDMLTNLLRSLYTGRLHVTEESNLVALILLSEKYMLTACTTQLVIHLTKNINESNAMECLQLELEKFEELNTAVKEYMADHASDILDGSSFLPFDVDIFSTLLTTLVNSSNGLKGHSAVYRWVNHNKEDRSKYSFDLTEAVELAMQRAPVPCSPKFITHQYSRNVFSHEDKRVIVMDTNRHEIYGTKCKKFKVILIDRCYLLQVGLAVGEDRYFLNCMNGTVSSSMHYARSVGMYAPCFANGTVIEVMYDKESIIFRVNGGTQFRAFVNIPDGDMYPVFVADCYASFELM
jgi:hypothetical protein